MSRFPDPRAPDPRLDALRQRTGQNQAPQQQAYPQQQPYPQQSQYPLQDFAATQQPWPRETTQPPYAPTQPANSGYANGQQTYGDDQGYGAGSNGYGAGDPYGQGYGAPQHESYPYSNAYAQQQHAQRALPAPAPQGASSQQQRPREQQAGPGYPAPQTSGGARLSRSLAQQQAQQAYPQPTPPQPAAPAYAPYTPPQTYSQVPQTQTPTTAGRRAGDVNGQGYGGLQPRQDAQVAAFGGWQQTPPSAPSRPSPAQSHSHPAAQPQADLYGLTSGYGTSTPSPQSYGAQQSAAPVQTQPFGLGVAPQSPQHGGSPALTALMNSPPPSSSSYAPAQPSFAPQTWGSQSDDTGLGSLQPATQDFGFEAPIDTLGDSFAVHGQASSFDQSYAEDEAEYEEAGGKRSFKKVAFLLGLFVAVGGSLALAYSMLLGSPSPTQTASQPPVIKGDERPTKVKPSDPGGKQFSYTDSKMLGRVGEGGVPQAATGSSTGSGDIDPVTGARKVPLLTVGRDGSIQSGPQPSQQADAAPAGVAAAQPSSSQTRAVIAVPGMTVIDGIGQGPLGAPATTASTTPPAQPPQQQAAPQQQPSAQQPKAAQIITASEPPAKPLVVSPPQAEKKATAAPKKVAVAAADAAATGAAVAQPSTSAVAAPSPSVTGAGYVTVLASVPASGSSRDVAMRQFQDMQQKYASALSGKVADVVEANLGEKGTYHRLIAGPPGSKESANQLCNDLKAQGYASCWVTAY